MALTATPGQDEVLLQRGWRLGVVRVDMTAAGPVVIARLIH
jgi:hypothetical protein